MDQSELVDRMHREADAAEELAARYGHEAELRTQYDAEARTWRSAARMVKAASEEQA